MCFVKKTIIKININLLKLSKNILILTDTLRKLTIFTLFNYWYWNKKLFFWISKEKRDIGYIKLLDLLFKTFVIAIIAETYKRKTLLLLLNNYLTKE